MDVAEWILTIVTLVAVVALIVWFVLVRRHPENAAGHAEATRTDSSQYYGDVDDRPAGPGAEAQGVAGPGEPIAGPLPDPGDERPG